MEKIDELDKLLIKLKIYPNVKGYDYIKYALTYFDRQAFMGNMTKYVYPLIGKEFNASASKVERAIRHLMYNTERIEALNNLLGFEDKYKIEKITNGEFLSILLIIFRKDNYCKKCLNTELIKLNDKVICNTCGEEHGTIY